MMRAPGSAIAATLIASLALLSVSLTAAAQPADIPGNALPSQGRSQSTEVGFGIFQNTCLSCHGKAEYKDTAPSPEQLRTYSPERIYAALTNGAMKAVGDTLSDTQRRIVAQAVAGRVFSAASPGDAAHMSNQCKSATALADAATTASWNGWGNSPENARFQSTDAAGLTVDSVPHLKLRWAFGLPNSTSSYSQPTVYGQRVFVGTDTGYVYSIDARSGCVYWSFLADAAVRNAPTVAPLRRDGHAGHAVYFGDLKANVYGIDAQSGALLWKTHVDPQYTTRVTAAPAFHDGRLFVPVSSWEEFSARTLDYPCCTSVGSIVALDARDGRQLWKTYVIQERPHPTRRNSKGVQQYGPAGASIWNTPTVDARRHAIYFGTGDATTYPPADAADSIMALDMRNGRRLWSYQVTRDDSFLVGCRDDGITDNCPRVQGPDWDIPCSPILTRLTDGRSLIIVGTKPGDVLALDPARGGALVWRMNIFGDLADPHRSSGPQRPPGIQWGGGVYHDTVYYGLTAGGRFAAIDLKLGKLLWLAPLTSSGGAESVSYAAPATIIPGVVFLGGSDGSVVAASSDDGHVLWRFETNRDFDAVNQIPAHGGSIGSSGVTVAGGLIFVGSGYSVLGNSLAGNALLAFGSD
jgi:polyvinyl alcohol dehydrogenase (cytochrome)